MLLVHFRCTSWQVFLKINFITYFLDFCVSTLESIVLFVVWNKYCAYGTYWFGFHIVTGRQGRQVHMCCFLNCAAAEAET